MTPEASNSTPEDAAVISEPKVWIESIEFSGGEIISLLQDDIVLIVGANNSGKSKTLQELQQLIHKDDSQIANTLNTNLVVKGASLGKLGDAATFKKYLETNTILKNSNYSYRGGQIHHSHTVYYDRKYLPSISNVFQLMLNATGRTNSVNSVSSITPTQTPTVAQHFLYNDYDLMQRVSDLFNSAFGKELFFNYRGGPQLPIHVGDKPICEPNEQYVDNSYVEKVTAFPLIETQGDGIKSYTGILFQTIVFPRDLTYIDEPEAFLHPPQMRRLGKTLAENSKGQLVVATHSTDILRGFLEGHSNRIRVIRLLRDGDVNHATELSSTQVQALWNHPQIRYSTALDAIFHEQAIICEDDSDCRLYSAIASHLEESDSSNNWPDTHYIPTGGKHAAARVAKALHELNVPTKMVFDFDLLSNKESIKTTYESVGGDWSEIKSLWEQLDAAVRSGVKAKSLEEIATEISGLLTDLSEGLPKSKIQEILKQDKSWAIAKKLGSGSIPNGHATQVYNDLNELLRSKGIYIVEKGEIEQFCPSIGGHGPKFVNSLLETKDLSSSELSDLRNFVKLVVQ